MLDNTTLSVDEKSTVKEEGLKELGQDKPEKKEAGFLSLTRIFAILKAMKSKWRKVL